MIVLIAEVDASQETMGITSCRRTDADIAVMIAPTYHTRLAGDTEPVAAVILPE